MSKVDIVLSEKRRPTIVSEAEYETISTLFAQGLDRSQVIKKMGYDKNWYYSRLSKDMKLKKVEQDGNNAYLENISKDVTGAIKKSILGHKVTTKKVLYEYVTDAEGNQVKVPRSEVKEEKYYPPNSAVLTAVGKRVLKTMQEDDNVDVEIDKKIRELSEGDLEGILQIAEKVFIEK